MGILVLLSTAWVGVGVALAITEHSREIVGALATLLAAVVAAGYVIAWLASRMTVERIAWDPSDVDRGGDRVTGWRRLRLAGADLRDADLRDLDLTGVDLRDARLTGADLRGAVLRRALLGGAQLNGAILRGARLDGATASGADFSGADLRYATLVSAKLDDANMRACNLKRADLTRAKVRGTKLLSVDLTGAIYRRVRFDDAVLSTDVQTFLLRRQASSTAERS